MQFYLFLPGEVDEASVIDALNKVDIVELAEAVPLPAPAPNPPDYSTGQGYLNAATDGIGAATVWANYGTRGAGIRLADIEYGFNANHKDLPNVTIVGNAPGYPPNLGADQLQHGTAVLGEIASLDINVTIDVSKATLTVTANDATRSYGEPNPTFTPTYIGFVNGEGPSVLIGSPTLTSTATAGSSVGPCAITAAQGTLSAANYGFTFVPGTLTISKAVATVTLNAATLSQTYDGAPKAVTASPTPSGLTVTVTYNGNATAPTLAGRYPVTADDKTRTYGGAMPALTATYTGFVNGDTPASLTMAVSLATTATAASGVGSYPIIAGGAASPNYTITFASGNLLVTPAGLTITADNKTKLYGGVLPTLTASYSGFVNNEGPNVLTTPVTLATTATAASGVGSYPITASGAAAANYTITYAAGTLSVTPATLNITADGKSKVYGAGLPTLTASYSGFVNNDGPSALPTPVTLTTTATASSGVGSYPITPGGAVAANYAITYGSGNLLITPASLTVKADDKTRTYGGAMPALTATYTGFVNGDSPSSLTMAVSLATTATASSGVGSYSITAGGAASPNYTITYANGNLLISPAGLTITADNKSKVYGGALPTLTVSYSGFVNNEGPSVLPTPVTLATTATATSGVGSYPIAASGAAAANYTITCAAGTLSVTPATLNITADGKSKVYGAVLPTLTATYSGFVNGDTPASLTTPVALATSATASSGVDFYPITASGAAAANYSITY